MLRIAFFLILAHSIFPSKIYGQEWLSTYNQALDYFNNDQLNEAYTSCKSALVMYESEAELDHVNYRAILRQLSVTCYSLNELNDGRNYAQQEVESWRGASKVDELSYIDALDNLGIIYTALGEYEKAIEILTECLNSSQANQNKSDVDKAIIEGHLAEALYGAGEISSSAAHFEACLKVLDSVDEIPGDYISFCYSYGTLSSENENYPAAIKYLSILFQWYDEADTDPLVINTNLSLGTAYTKSNSLKKGEYHYQLVKSAYDKNSTEYEKEIVQLTKLLALNIEQQGRHDEAQQLMTSITMLEGNDEVSAEQAYFLNTQATILLNIGKVNEALEKYDQALKMMEILDLEQSEGYAAIALNTIRAQDRAANIIRASELAEKTLALQSANDIIYYQLTAELGAVLRKQGRYDEANDAYDLIYNADRSQWPTRKKAQILNKAASHYQMQGLYSKSQTLFLEGIPLVNSQEDQALYQSIVFNYITLLQARGKLSEAENMLLDLKNSIGSDNPAIYLGILRNMGSLAQAKGDYNTAQERYSEALNIARDISGETGSEYADILLRQATLDKDMGNYQEAEPKFIKVSEIIAATDGRQHPNYASVANNMGILYQQMGNFEKAESDFKEAVAIYKSAFGDENPDYVLSLENLATLYELMGKPDQALDILVVTLKTNKRIYGETNPNYAVSLHNYASLLQKTNRKDEAFNMYKQVLKLQEESIGTMQPSYANTLLNLAILAQEQEKYEMADSMINDVLNIRGTLLGKSHPAYTSALYSKAVLLQVTNRYDEGWLVYNEVVDQYLGQIRKYFPSLSENEKNAFYAKVTPVINRYKEFCIEYYVNYRQSPEIISRLYNVQLATKALLLNAVNKTRSRILGSGDEVLIKEFNQWTNLKIQLVRYYGYSKEQVAAQGIDIPSLEDRANTLEKSLTKSSELFAKEFEKTDPNWQQVAERLNENEVALEIIRIERNGIKDSVSYVAMAVTANSANPVFTTLPYGQIMETKFYSYYNNTIKYQVKDEKSFYHYWAAIDPLVNSAKTIYISADGVYNKININTIYNVNSGKYLIEDYFVKYISSTRDLIAPVAVKDHNQSPSMLCLGDPTYDLESNTPDKPVILNDQQRSHLNMNQISPLPGTKIEVDYIDSLLRANNWQVSKYVRKEALEKQLKFKISPTVIHLATHGFFMPDMKARQLESQTGINEHERNPLVRSGLLFAGASNQNHDTENDGILTAYEAMNLYLDNTELVVLSACETALGDIKNGEGVYGLQRALQVAGAKNLIMSLWKVNDEATMELMRLFYTNWVGGENIYHSLQQAQLTMLNEDKPPYFWGAFIMIGR